MEARLREHEEYQELEASYKSTIVQRCHSLNIKSSAVKSSYARLTAALSAELEEKPNEELSRLLGGLQKASEVRKLRRNKLRRSLRTETVAELEARQKTVGNV